MDLIVLLDTRTVAFVTGLAGFVMAATMLGLYAAGMRERALLHWAFAGLAYGLGHQGGHLMLNLATPWSVGVSLALANTLIALGHVFGLIGIQRYLGRRPWTLPLLAACALLFAVSVAWEPMRASLRMRVLVLSTFYLGVDAIAGVLLWRARAEGLTAYRRIVALVLLLEAAFLVVRLGYAAVTDTLTTSFVQDPFQILFYLLSMVFVFVLALALALLMFRGKEVELQWLVMHDPLTGLFNRRSLDEHAAREIAHCRRHGVPLSAIVFDIDHFKRINDTRGHLAGDEVIRAVARRVAMELRASDIAFRLGGEEFLLLLPSTAANGAATLAERLRAGLASTPLEALGAPVTASFGVAELGPGETWNDALRRADQAMYRAKREGRDRVVGAAPTEPAPGAPVPADAPA